MTFTNLNLPPGHYAEQRTYCLHLLNYSDYLIQLRCYAAFCAMCRCCCVDSSCVAV